MLASKARKIDADSFGTTQIFKARRAEEGCGRKAFAWETLIPNERWNKRLEKREAHSLNPKLVYSLLALAGGNGSISASCVGGD